MRYNLKPASIAINISAHNKYWSGCGEKETWVEVSKGGWGRGTSIIMSTIFFFKGMNAIFRIVISTQRNKNRYD